MSIAHVDVEFTTKKRARKSARIANNSTCVGATLTLRRPIKGVILQDSSGRLRVGAAVDIKFHFPSNSLYTPELVEFYQKRGTNDLDGNRNLPRRKHQRNHTTRPYWIQVTNDYADPISIWDYYIYLKLASGAPGDFVIDPEIENTDDLPNKRNRSRG